MRISWGWVLKLQSHLKELAKSIPFGIVLVIISAFGYLSDPVDNPHFGEDDASRFVGSVYTYTLKPVNSLIKFVFDSSGIIESSERLIEYATGTRLMGPGQAVNAFFYFILVWSLIGYLGSLVFIFSKRHFDRPKFPSFWKFSAVFLTALLIFTSIGFTWIEYQEKSLTALVVDAR